MFRNRKTGGVGGAAGLAIGCDLWETSRMEKPDLVITSFPDDGFLAGHCSSCHSVKFTLQGNTMHHKKLLRGMFDQHFKRVHMREDANQAAAGIVRETTEQK